MTIEMWENEGGFVYEDDSRETRTLVQPVRVDYLCEECNLPMSLPDVAMSWGYATEHRCSNGHMEMLSKNYPYIEYKEISGDSSVF